MRIPYCLVIVSQYFVFRYLASWHSRNFTTCGGERREDSNLLIRNKSRKCPFHVTTFIVMFQRKRLQTSQFQDILHSEKFPGIFYRPENLRVWEKVFNCRQSLHVRRTLAINMDAGYSFIKQVFYIFQRTICY